MTSESCVFVYQFISQYQITRDLRILLRVLQKYHATTWYSWIILGVHMKTVEVMFT